MPRCPGLFSSSLSAFCSALRPACSKAVAASLAVLLVAACGPVPQPYRSAPEDRANNALLEIPDGQGVTVAPVAGAPPALSGPLTEAMVAALQEAGIPASSGALLTNSFLMEGNASWQDGTAVIDWQLSDQDGEETAKVRADVPADRDAFRTGDDALIADLAQRSAMLVAAALRPDTVLQAVAESNRTVAVAGVEGAPGDGNRALARAMEAVLTDAGVELVEDAATAALVLAGVVTLEPLENEMELVSIEWILMTSDGTVMGSIEQSNAVPLGSLADRWGGAAYDAALANVEAIRGVLEQIDEIRDLQRQANEFRN